MERHKSKTIVAWRAFTRVSDNVVIYGDILIMPVIAVAKIEAPTWAATSCEIEGMENK